MKEAVENLIGKLVDDSEAVEVSANVEGKTTIIDVRVAESDMGRLIGRRGRTIKAIRSLLFYSGQKCRQKLVLNILED